MIIERKLMDVCVYMCVPIYTHLSFGNSVDRYLADYDKIKLLKC